MQTITYPEACIQEIKEQMRLLRGSNLTQGQINELITLGYDLEGIAEQQAEERIQLNRWSNNTHLAGGNNGY